MSKTAPYTPLWVESHYSLLRSVLSVEAIVERAVADGQSAAVLTDFATLSGAIAFRRACRKAAIRPIIGLTLPVTYQQITANIILLARNATGYRSLCQLTTQLQAHADRHERIANGLPFDQLAHHANGLIAIDGGFFGLVHHFLSNGSVSDAEAWVEKFGRIYPSHAYIGLPSVQKSAPRFTLPYVALSPTRCETPTDRETLRLMQAVERNCLLSELPDNALPSDDVRLDWLSSAETLYKHAPDALTATHKIISLCEDPLPDGTPIWPVLDLPLNTTPNKALTLLANNGLKTRYPNGAPTGAATRLQHELAAIATHGFAPLFYIVADIVRYARQNNVPISTRGSVANSLVAYTLGISDVDPLEHDLLFERFLNPARKSLPDIDLDFCSVRRDQVLNYVRDRYGANHVALVSTIVTFKRRSAVREAAKALGATDTEIKQLTAKLPRGWHPDPRRRDRRTLREFLHTVENERERDLLEAASGLLGHPQHLSVHPGGMVITPTDLTDFVPLQWSPKGFLLTQYDHTDVEAIGLPKLDLLGIRALTVLADSAEYIRHNHDPTFTLDQIPDNDPTTAAELQRATTVGVFQCESHGAQRTMRKLQTRTIHDLAVANAFFKPGPANGGMAGNFVRRYRGEEAVSYLHPILEPILGSTKGVLLFQEQILRVVVEVAGLNWQQANQIRKGMSKFQAEAMEALAAQFINGCQRPAVGLSPRQAHTLWQQVLAFAGYGFNQGHATAYAVVSYRSAWMKSRYPAAFLAARLARGGGYHHPAVYIAEARRLGIRVRSPQINHSQRRFSLETASDGTQTLWAGLGSIRDLRRKTVARIVENRPFVSLTDLFQRVPMHEKEFIHLIQAGGLDGLGGRQALLVELAGLRRSGGGRQMRFDFGETAGAGSFVPSQIDDPAQLLSWEKHLLGYPISAEPPLPTTDYPLRKINDHLNQTITIAGYRLPAWDDDGFLFSDRTNYIRAVFPRSRADQFRKPLRWQPTLLTGQWRTDRFGNHAFVIEQLTPTPR